MDTLIHEKYDDLLGIHDNLGFILICPPRSVTICGCINCVVNPLIRMDSIGQNYPHGY